MTPPFDRDAALRGTEGSPELLRELAGILLGQLPDAQAAIQQAILRRDGPGLQRQAHQLAGGLALFGAAPALNATRHLEALAKSQGELMDKSAHDAGTTYESTRTLVIALAAVAMVLAVAIAAWITLSIVRPIRQAVLVAERL